MNPGQDVEYVYRALRSRRWVQNGIIQENAFRRRTPTETSSGGSNGLSVDFIQKVAANRFAGMGPAIRLSVAKLREIGLTIYVDGNGHPNIAGVPYDLPENLSEVLKYAAAIAICAE